MNIYIHSTLPEELRQRIKSAIPSEFTIYFRPTTNTDLSEDQQAFEKADFLLGNPPAAWFEHHRPELLKFWQLDSAGFDQFKNVTTGATVANMGDWFARPCAETIVGGILTLYRGLNTLTLLQKERIWVGAEIRKDLSTLFRKKAIVLGAGTIGQAIRDILKGFQCEVKLMARTSPEAQIHSLEQLLSNLPQADLLINTLPGSAHHFVNAEVISAMKHGSVYANVGRGNNTDEAQVIQALTDQKLGGAVLDVTEQEPLSPDSILWRLPNVVLTQHSGGGFNGEDVGKAEIFIRNFALFNAGHKPENQVQIGRGY